MDVRTYRRPHSAARSFGRIASLASLLAMTCAVLAACDEEAAPTVAPQLEITAVDPAEGPTTGGTRLLIVGVSIREGAEVTIRGESAEVVAVYPDSSMIVLTPVGGLGAADVTVTDPSGAESTLEAAFTYMVPANAGENNGGVVVEPDPLTLSKALPDTVGDEGGDSVVLVGTGFDPEAQVQFGEQPALTQEVLGDKTILTTAPALPPGRVNISVRNPNGDQVVLPDPIIVVDFGEGGEVDNTLKLQSVHPDEGRASAQTRVAIVGGGFLQGAEVTIGGIEATDVVLRSSSVILATVPPGVPGPSTVTVTQVGSEPANLVGGFNYIDDSLQLTDVHPPTGPTSGGKSVLLVGQGFVEGMTVQFGETAATEVTVINPRAARVLTPVGVIGAVEVSVVREGSPTVRLPEAYTFTDDSLQLTAVRPGSGSVGGGFEVAVVGQGFYEGVEVLFGDTPADAVVVDSGTVLRATAPAHVPGMVDVTVTTPEGNQATLTASFDFIDDGQGAFALGAAVPNQGSLRGGIPVALSGSGLDDTVSVSFGGVDAPIIEILSAEVIVVTAPAGEVGAVPIVAVSGGGETTTLIDGYTYNDQVQLFLTGVTGIVPIAGPDAGGTRVAIHGSGLGEVAEVRFGDTVATDVNVVGDTLLTAVTPSGAAGPVDVTAVLNDNRELTLNNAFFYYDAGSTVDPPDANSVRPEFGPTTGGTPFVIRGTRFAADAQVLIGGKLATDVRWLSGQAITGRTPSSTEEGPADVAVFHGDGRVSALRSAFTYYRPGAGAPGGPSVVGVSPPTASTLGGAEVAATGSNFRDGLLVFIDGVPAQEVFLNSGERVTMRVPAHPEGPATVTVVNTDGTYADLNGGLTYVPQPPVIADLLPTEGPEAGFTALTIRGAGFDPEARVTVGGQAAIDVVVLSSSLILAVTPPAVAATVDVTVTNPGDLADTLEDSYTYFEGGYTEIAPVVEAISPNRGPLTGGSVVRFIGENLRPGARVLFGGVEAQRIVVVNDTTATVTTPPFPVGTVDVAWINPDGQASIVREGFTFTDGSGTPASIGGLTPNRGPAAGGTPSVMAGSGFTQGTEVFFGDVPAVSVAVLGDGFLSMTTPAGVPGVTNVTVTNRQGFTTTLPNGYTYVASPEILGVQPAVGPTLGGTVLQIGGRNFLGGASVLIGDVSAIGVQVLGDNLISATTPPGALGPVDITVRNPDGQQTVAVGGFEYLNSPEVGSVWPESGPTTGGTRVVVGGTNFRAGLRIYFGADEGSDVRWVDDSRATVVVPPGGAGPVDVRVVNADLQESILGEAYTRVDPSGLGPAATVISCFPSAGSTEGGTRIRVSGTNFQPLARVFIDGYPAITGYVDNQALAATTPAHEPDSVAVSVTNPDGQTGNRAGCFQYTDALGNEPDPIVTVIAPLSGPTVGGAEVTITGDFFQDGALVLVGDRIATSVVVENPTRITAVTPPGVLGPADVVVVNPDGKVGILSNGYSYLAPPSISAVTPSEGPSIGGTPIIITGEGFLDGATVRVGGVLADQVELVSGTEIHALTPAGAPGPVAVSVVNADGQVGQLPAAFVYNEPPVVSSVDPPMGSTDGGEYVSIFGSGFRAGLTVFFGLDQAPEVQVLSGTELRALTPSAPVGTVAIIVTNPDGFESTLPGAFDFVPPPDIQAVSPQGGPTAGGVTVTIVGRFFQDGARVYFGADEAPMVTWQNSSVLEVTTPARAAGPAAVIVLNPDGQQAELPGGFVYLPPIPEPTVNAVSPNFGPVIGGTLTNVLGADFQVGMRVFFGPNEVPTQSVTVISASQVRVRVPPGVQPGAVDVRVVNPDGQEDTLVSGFTYLPALALPPIALNSVTPNRSPVEGGQKATVLGNGLASDVQFFAERGGESIPIPILAYYSPTAVFVELPPVPMAGQWDLRAYLPSSSAEVTLGAAIDYRDYSLALETRPGRLPLDARGSDFYHVIADLNNDGFNDAFILRDRYQSRIYLNRGAEEPGYFNDVTDANLTGEPADHYPQRYFGPIAADFNQDGFNDVVAFDIHYNNTNLGEVRSHHRIWASRGFGELVYSSTWARHNGAGVVREFVAADLDLKDGLDIFVCAQADNYVLWNRGIERDMNGDPVLDMDGRPNWLGFDRQPFRATVGGMEDVVPREDSRGCRVRDVNGDGAPDVIVANASNIANRLYLSNGDPDNPRFIDVSNSPQFQAAGDTRAVEAVDVDHDGNVDILFANVGQDDAVLMNDGAGNFTNQPTRLCHDDVCSLANTIPPFLSPTTYVGAYPSSKNRISGDSFLDYNGDGCVDLMIGYNGQSYMGRAYINEKIGDAPAGCTGQFYYHEGLDDVDDPVRGLRLGSLGAGRKGLMDDMNWGGGGNPYDDTRGTWADFDNDGSVDLFQTFSGRQNRLYLRQDATDGEGNDYKPLIDVTFEGSGPRDMGHGRRGAAKDLNGDGFLDLIIANYGECEWEDDRMKDRIYLNDGAGNFFDATERWPDQDILSTYEIVVEDFSGDGHPDILAFHEYEYNRTCHTAAGSRRPERTARSHGYFFGQVRYYQNDGFGFFENRTADANIAVNIGDRYGSIVDAEAVDVDNDGDLDIVAISSGRNYHRRLFINGGDPLGRGAPFFFDRSGDLPHRETGTNNDGCSEGHITCARAVTPIDFDMDGDQDLYLARGTLRNRLYRNDGSGVFTDVTGQFIQATTDNSYDAVVDYFADTDRLDIFVVNRGQKRIHVSNPTYDFSDLTDSHVPFNDSRFSLQGKSADFDMDGKIDVLTASITSSTSGENGPNSFYLNVGNAVFQNWTGQVVSPGLSEYTQDIVLGDFDNDGDTDAFYINSGYQNRLVENLLIDD